MENLKIIDKTKLLHNLEVFNTKKICAMVKANAYGHGLEEIVKILDGKVAMFGVANVEEGKRVRRVSQIPILVAGKVFDYDACKDFNLDFFVGDELDLMNAIYHGLNQNCHLKIDCGMHRFGVDEQSKAKRIKEIALAENVVFKTICTHFSQTDNKIVTKKQYQKFLLIKNIFDNSIPVCLGGSGVIDYGFEYDFLRVGIGLYGYEKNCSPILSLQSYVCEVKYVKAGEYVGYGSKYRVKSGGFYAIVPIGYGDGLKRCLGGRIEVEIGGKLFSVVGNICMDACFVKVDENIEVGQDVKFVFDAQKCAEKSNTISYEILTGLSSFRGKTIVI